MASCCLVSCCSSCAFLLALTWHATLDPIQVQNSAVACCSSQPVLLCACWYTSSCPAAPGAFDSIRLSLLALSPSSNLAVRGV